MGNAVRTVVAGAVAAGTWMPGDAAGIPIDVVEQTFVDTTRPTPAIGSVPASDRRLLRTWVYLPPSAEPAPLVLLAHGFNGHPRKFTDLAGHWAAAGYVVAVPEFPVSSDEFADTSDTVFGARVSDLAQQALDVSFVLDELLRRDGDATNELGGRIDPDRVGLYGLSLGSLTVWAAVVDHGEDRVDALIQSDGGFPGSDGSALASVPFPVFVAHSDVDTTFGPSLVLEQFGQLPAPKFLLVLHGAAHAAVGENTPTPADEAYRVATTVFWERYLRGRVGEPFPESIVIDGVTTFVGED